MKVPSPESAGAELQSSLFSSDMDMVPTVNCPDLESISFADVYKNQAKTNPNDKLATIIMVMADLKNCMLDPDSHFSKYLTNDEYVKKTPPYSEFLTTLGWKSKILGSKKLLSTEILCRCSTQKPNAKNRTLKQLMKTLAKYLLSDDLEIEFAKMQEQQFRLALEQQLDSKANDPKKGSTWQRNVDQLWFIVILTTKEESCHPI